MIKTPVAPVVLVSGGEKSAPSLSQTKLGPGLLPQTRVPGISGSEAAANWMKSAQSEANQPDAHQAAIQKAAVSDTVLLLRLQIVAKLV